TKVLHLHGEINKSRSSLDPSLVYAISGTEIKLGEKCEKGSQLRPHIVWFGEMVPMMDIAYVMAEKAELFMVIGTSLAVYPAAGIIDYTPSGIPKYLIDPGEIKITGISNLRVIKEKASIGLPILAQELLH
ncbi:MAG: NAD-dependent deacylase, partial [Bacteroidota bacterium]|nr:NAD-dependent deacylase [Bacteroidota bacterium]